MLEQNWSPNMFMDCERRNFVVQAYHRDLLEQKRNGHQQQQQKQPTSISIEELPKLELTSKSTSRSTTSRKQLPEHGRVRHSGSRRQRLRGAAS